MSVNGTEQFLLSINDLLWRNIVTLAKQYYGPGQHTEDEIVEAFLDFFCLVIEMPEGGHDLPNCGGVVSNLCESIFPSERLFRRLSECCRDADRLLMETRHSNETVIRLFPVETRERLQRLSRSSARTADDDSACRDFPEFYADLGEATLRSAYNRSGFTEALKSHTRRLELSAGTVDAFRSACYRISPSESWYEVLCPVVQTILGFYLSSRPSGDRLNSFREELSLCYVRLRDLAIEIDLLTSWMRDNFFKSSAVSNRVRKQLLLTLERIRPYEGLYESRGRKRIISASISDNVNWDFVEDLDI